MEDIISAIKRPHPEATDPNTSSIPLTMEDLIGISMLRPATGTNQIEWLQVTLTAKVVFTQ